MKLEASAYAILAQYDFGKRRIIKQPGYVLRIESETEEDKRALQNLFGEFKTDPLVVHLEFDSVTINLYDESQPCKSAADLGFT